jgi:glycosyltransferase involved in cell wall biosynthesis
MKIGMVLRRLDLNDGVASHLDTLCRELNRLGHQVVLLTGPVSQSGDWRFREDSLMENTIAWERTPELSFRTTPANWLGTMARRHGVTLLHIHGLRLLPSVRRALEWRLPIVATAHPSRTSTPDPGPAKLQALRLMRPLFRLFLPERVIAVSTEMANWFRRVAQVHPGQIRLVYHGCDRSVFFPPQLQERAQARAALGIADETFACVIVGRFDPGKRHETAVRALSQLADEGRNVSLLLVGSGDPVTHVRHLQEVADPQKRLDIRCKTNVTQLRSIYIACDALLLPSEREAFGLVVAEAMLCGLVPLRTPTGGARDQIRDGETGFLFEIGDDAKLADRLRWLLDHPAQRVFMGQAARSRALERFCSDVMAEKTVSVYQELIEGAEPDSRTILYAREVSAAPVSSTLAGSV